MDDERREFYRVMVRLPVRCLAVAADGSASLMMVRSVDMSAGGAASSPTGCCGRATRCGSRSRCPMADAGLGFHIDAEAEVAAVQSDPRGSHVVTLAFDGLDRVTRSSILRRAMEQERRERAGE